MKGIMVPLLVLGMTGIVIGQQQSLSNQFPGNSANAMPQGNAQGQNRLSPMPAQPQSVSENQLAPFELEVSQKDILGIKYDEEGFLQSRIEPIDPQTGTPLPISVINGISLVFSGKDSNSLISEKFSSAPQSHFVQGKSILAFGISDQDIANLQTRKLVYNFDFTERGKYDEVVIFYVPTAGAPSNSGPTPDNTANSNLAFGQGNNNVSRAPIIPPPAPDDSQPGEQTYMGPVRPSQLKQPTFGGLGSGIAQNQPPPSAWAPPGNRTLTNPDLSLAGQTDNRQPNNWTLPTIQTGQANPNALNQPATRQPTFEEQVALRRSQMEQERILQDLNQRKSILDAYEKDLLQKSAAVDRQQQELAQQKYLDSIRTSRPTDIDLDYSKPSGPVIGTNIGTGPVVERPERLASLDPNRFPVGAGDTTPPNRVGSPTMPRPTTGGIKDYTASISGTNLNQKTGTAGNDQNAAKQDKRVEGFVMFMLFCSLGLNIYLGWISRGFYVRYNELADELRETFTATM